MTAAIRDWGGPLRDTAQRAKVLHHVIVPLDGSEAAKLALPVARTLAELEGATIHVLHVGQQVTGARATLEELGLQRDDLRSAVLHQAAGQPLEAIRQLASELHDSAIVMCTHTADPEQDKALGSVADGLLALGSQRIIFVTPDRGHQEWHLRCVVMAHDGSPSADAALSPVADLAQRAGAEVVALHVAGGGAERPQELGSLPAPLYMDQPQHEWPAWANEFMGRMLALGAPPASFKFRLLVAGGQTGSEIAQFARDHNADLVVLPWHGPWKEQHSGAVDCVIRNSGCPVLLFCTA